MPGEEEARVGSSAQLATTALTTTTTTPSSGSGAASSTSSSSATTSSSAVPKVALPVLALRGNPASTTTGSVPSLTTASGGSGVSSSTLATISAPPASTIAPIAIASCPPTTVNNNNSATTINATGAALINLNSSGLNSAGTLSLKPITSITPNGHSSSPSLADTKRDAGTCNGHGGSHYGGGGIEDDEIDEAGDSSKRELQLQFAGIDNETVDVDVEDEENNYEGGIEGGPMRCTGRRRGTVVVASSAAAAGSVAPTSTTSSTLGGGGGGTGPTNSLGVGGQLVGTTTGGGGSTLGDEEEDEEEEDVEGGKTVECTEVVVPDQTFAEKCLFYTTAFFILLAVFSLFAFLFLVPFVIDPAFTTIFMEFDPEPAFCQTVSLEQKEGSSNCNWTSCREGCTREVFQCKQIKVNYRSAAMNLEDFQGRPNNNRNNHNTINHVSNHGGSSSSLASSDLRRSEHSGSSFNTPLHNYNNLISHSLIGYGGGVVLLVVWWWGARSLLSIRTIVQVVLVA
ncbi:Protein tipE [Orchesella cincta]|uniref:Protein tipE n=1 Tax=Orchesella cincta TaxID=48709 RepID=A0A1D2MNS9_ORCCI|nr:Protein tipE [Orchesella cincta]